MDEEKIKELYEVFFIIDENYFPNGNEWIAGENVTVADFAYVATISTLVVSFIVILLLWWNVKNFTTIETVLSVKYFSRLPLSHFQTCTKALCLNLKLSRHLWIKFNKRLFSRKWEHR